MPYTNQRPAGAAKVIGLAIREVLFTFSWAALGGAILLPFTKFWFAAVLPAFLLAVYYLARMEISADTGPLLSLELRQYSTHGRRNLSVWRTAARILCTSLLFPPFLLSCITLLFNRRSLPELITGTKLTLVDRRFDPRPEKDLEEIRISAANRTRTLILVPFAASLAVFGLYHSAPEVISPQDIHEDYELPESERELLTHYLEMTSLHPEELEFHVRLASLYYRNNMEQDLMNQLDIISEIDPEHAILILSDTSSFSFDMLQPLEPDSGEAVAPTTQEITADPVQEDSTAADTLTESYQDSLTTHADSIAIPEIEELPDTLFDSSPDTLPESIATDSAVISPPADTLDTAADESAPADADPVTAEPEETVVEPDTVIQP